MKSFFSIIIGVSFGVACSVVLITSNLNIAFSEEKNWFDFSLAEWENQDFDWNKVFNPFVPSERGKDLYNLVYGKLYYTPEQNALEEVAYQNGLTTKEADAVINGSLIPILNNPGKNRMTQEDAAKILSGMQDHFRDLKEIYDIEQEVKVAIAPGEIFANGDIADSGFDLVHDLTTIEEILFLDTTENSVGAPFKDALDKPYNPAEPQRVFLDDYIVSETPGAILRTTASLEASESSSTSEENENQTESNINNATEILLTDVCSEDSSLENALDNFDENSSSETGENDESGDVNDGYNEDDGDSDSSGGGERIARGNESVVAAPRDNWGQPWCPTLNINEAAVLAGLAPGKTKSLGGVSSPIPYGGIQANLETSVSINAGVCFSIQYVTQTISSYQPGDSCVACEVEKINELLDRTVSYSLLPNKVTGNMLESAKCKDLGNAINLQFITIWNPVPTPANDDLIYGKNIFEEWNKFVERYQPAVPWSQEDDLGSTDFEANPGLSQDFQTERVTDSAPPNTTQEEVYEKIQKIKNSYTAKAALEMKAHEDSIDVTNSALYSQNVLREIQQMNALFSAFQNNFTEMSKVLTETCKKPNID